MIDISKARAGDTVTIFATFRGANCKYADVSVTLSGDESPTYLSIEPKEIATHTPRGPSIGDKVVFRSNPKGSYGFVRHVREGNVWVEWSPSMGPSYHEVLPADGLERVS